MPENTGRDILRGKTVLLTEDEMLIGLDLKYALEDTGAQVIGPLLTLDHAIQQGEVGKFDIALLDINLRGQMVYPLAYKLLKARVPFLFHSGHGILDSLEKRFPHVVICTKPCAIPYLVDQAAGVLRAFQD